MTVDIIRSESTAEGVRGVLENGSTPQRHEDTKPGQVPIYNTRLFPCASSSFLSSWLFSPVLEASCSSTTAGEDLAQFLRRNNFELGVGAVPGFLVSAPSSKLRRVTEATALHVVVGDFDYQLRTKRLP